MCHFHRNVILAANGGPSVPATIAIWASGPTTAVARAGVVSEPTASSATSATESTATDDVVPPRQGGQVCGDDDSYGAGCVTRAAAPARAGAARLSTNLLPHSHVAIPQDTLTVNRANGLASYHRLLASLRCLQILGALITQCCILYWKIYV